MDGDAAAAIFLEEETFEEAFDEADEEVDEIVVVAPAVWNHFHILWFIIYKKK